MYILEQTLLLVGGITLLLLGLKNMSENTEKLMGDKMKSLIYSVTNNKFFGVLTGTFTTAIAQSSIAINIILVGFVNVGVMNFYQASSVIMGANIGTTITAQLVSLSGAKLFDVTAFGSLIAFIGFLLSLVNNKKVNVVGGIMIGFGMLFIGLKIVGNSIGCFKGFEWFRAFFAIKNPFVLVLNGIVITAILQSSSALASVMIVLATNGLMTFESSMFLLLGANIGACITVVIISLNKNVFARRTAVFNLFFNILGTLIFFIPLVIYGKEISLFFESFSGNIEREIANFHTLFNITVTLILLPFLKPFTTLIEKFIKDEDENVKNSKKIQSFALKLNK